jgi:hypothetical protein
MRFVYDDFIYSFATLTRPPDADIKKQKNEN